MAGGGRMNREAEAERRTGGTHFFVSRGRPKAGEKSAERRFHAAAVRHRSIEQKQANGCHASHRSGDVVVQAARMFVTQDDRWIRRHALDGMGASAQPHPCLTIEEKKRASDEMIGPQRKRGIGRPEPVGERQRSASAPMTFAPEAGRANRTAASEALRDPDLPA
jgi:hypothetical protein